MQKMWNVPLLAIVTVLAGLPAGTAAAGPGTGTAAPKTLVVDLGQRTGPVRHGGNGVLYGVSDPGVPSDNLLQPLKIRAIAGKAPDGEQHPNGDTLVVADQFVRTGGQDIHVYLQDFYPHWPYDDLGFADYLPKIEAMARKIAAHPQRRHFVYVPFNEPDWIWYGLSNGDPAAYARGRDRFLADWTTAFRTIRAIDPGARIAGPNEAFYDRRFLPEFFAYAKANGVLPDVMTWHELPTLQLERYRQNYADFRALERGVGIGPLPVNINEYAGRRDLSVPGRLLQWVTVFEDTKVDAGGQAYWDAAGNLAGTASQTNLPTGSWWMFKMYADMTGDTVAVTPPVLNKVDTLQGVASLDPARRQAHVLLGGEAGDAVVEVRGVDRALFGRTAHLTLSRTEWSGYDADAPPPAVLAERDVPVGRDGTVRVPVDGMDAMAAYEVVLSPGGHGTASRVDLPWRARYEAEAGTIVSGQVFTQGTPVNFNGYAASGTQDVGSLNRPDSSVTLSVTVPRTGAYDVGILYGNQSGGPAQQVLTVDGGQARFVEYPVTLNWLYRARANSTVRLTAGTHRLTLATTGPIGTARGEVTLDRVDVTAITAAPDRVRYQAELAQPTGAVSYGYDRADSSGAGYVRLGGGGSTTFVVSVPANGYYDIATRYGAAGRRGGVAARLTLDGGPLAGAVLRPASRAAAWHTATELVYLSAGVHRIGVRAATSAPVLLDELAVTRSAAAAQASVRTIEAEAAGNTLTGPATVEANAYASAGGTVTGVGGTGTLTLNGITARRAGQYTLVVHYANDDRVGGHAYNTNIISRATDIAVNGGAAQRVWFRNTWDWNNIWSIGIPVTLRAGANTITLSRADGLAPVFDKLEVAQTRLTR
ncbi:MAG TPA: hypothetical protein VMU51_13470 [Mycobacteriales bacterium]|nr:hypothetical protein [Mycobacteriales bacterium]